MARAAEAVGVSYQAVNKWPDVLPPRIEDRVYAALWRMRYAKAAIPGAPKFAEEAAHV